MVCVYSRVRSCNDTADEEPASVPFVTAGIAVAHECEGFVLGSPLLCRPTWTTWTTAATIEHVSLCTSN